MPDDAFARTVSVLDDSLSVELITEWDLVCCSDADPPDWKKCDRLGIDQVPFKDGAGKITAVRFRDRSESLREDWLISHATPITDFIRIAEPSVFRLVVARGRIGIVTRSDLNKLPVRLLVFARITFLEMLLASEIEQNYPNDSWRKKCPNIAASCEKWFEKNKQKNESTSLLAEANFEQKAKILDNPFGNCLDEMVALRNQLAHSKEVTRDTPTLGDFLKRYRYVEEAIETLRRMP